MIYIGVIGLVVILGLAARRPSRGDRASPYFLVSTVPLVLTIVVPLPFVLATGGPAGWARMAVVAASRVGVGLSVILAAIGIVLTLRAALAGDRRTALLLSLETALAGLPAGIAGTYAALTQLL